MLQTGHHRQHQRQPGDDRPKRTGGRQGAGACCFFFARGVRAHIRGSAPEPQRVSCCAADAWGARLMACATSVGGKSGVGRAAPARVVSRWCDSPRPPRPRGGARSRGRRTPWRGLRARAGSSSNLGHVKAIVPWFGRRRQGAKQDRYLGSHVSVCGPAARASAISLRQEQRMRGMAQPESAKPQLGESGRQHDGSRR